MIGFILIHALQTRDLGNSLTMELKIWILFAITSTVFGLYVAVNQGLLFSAIFTFCQYLILMYGVIYISNHDTNIDYVISIFIVFALLSAITTLFWGIDYGEGRISLGLRNNPNSLGMTMVFGVCCILFKQNFEKIFISIFALSVILLMIYVTLLTGSRKSFLSIVIIIVYWFIFIVFKDLRALQLTARIKGILSVLLVIGVGIYILYPYFNDSLLLRRLIWLFERGAETRESMYSQAFDLFKQSPLIGIGFNNYRALSIFGLYSHSTYAEALSCTGVIGSIFYFSPYIMLLSHYGKLVTCKPNELLLKQIKVMLGLFAVLLFLGIGVIHFYEMTSSIAFGMLIAFYKVAFKSLENREHIKPNTSDQ